MAGAAIPRRSHAIRNQRRLTLCHTIHPAPTPTISILRPNLVSLGNCMPVATLSGLTVRYGSKTAVNDLSVDVPEGCIGLLGPNGAGKSTLLKTLLGFLKPAAGSGSVLGLDIATQGMAIRQRVGLMPENPRRV